MQFDKSSQLKSWIFSLKSLADCKRRSVSIEFDDCDKRRKTIRNRVRKFASGFHKRVESEIYPDIVFSSPDLLLRNQEVLIQFHAHQIQFLIGPNAVLYDLRTSEQVLSTAIMFFRRFYLSNSVIEISPRKIAAACAFFAAKAEEEKVEVRKKDSMVLGGGGVRWISLMDLFSILRPKFRRRLRMYTFATSSFLL
jgi:cyclin H